MLDHERDQKELRRLHGMSQCFDQTNRALIRLADSRLRLDAFNRKARAFVVEAETKSRELLARMDGKVDETNKPQQVAGVARFRR